MATLDLDQSRARYVRIAEDLKTQILAGRFGPEGRLPTTRDLARTLRVNRNTVIAAYAKLAEWGFARAHVGRGTFAVRPASVPGKAGKAGPGGTLLDLRPERTGEGIARPLVPSVEAVGPDPVPRTSGRAGTRRPSPVFLRSSAPWTGLFSRPLESGNLESLAAIYSVETVKGAISFAGSFPALELLPQAAFRNALDKVLSGRTPRALAYGPAQGSLVLREWIAQDMTERGIRTEADEILITNGSQQAIDLIARAFVDPGNLVLLENPTYSGAISTFHSFGARLAGLPLDGEGLVTGAIPRLAARGGAKLLYTIPSFQNPTTGILTAPRRRQILEEAAAAGLLVVEDDWASGLRFEGEDPPTLRALDPDGRVIYISTFAKKLIPSLRIGWIAAARPIVERLTVLKQINDCCTSPLFQAALHRFCRDGDLDQHLRRVRGVYRARRDRMIAAMERRFPSAAAWSVPPGGLFLWVRLPEGVDSGSVAAEAEPLGVLVSRGEPFHLDGGGRRHLRLTFASSRPSEIDEGVRRLGALLHKHAAAAGRRPAAARREAVPLV